MMSPTVILGTLTGRAGHKASDKGFSIVDIGPDNRVAYFVWDCDQGLVVYLVPDPIEPHVVGAAVQVPVGVLYTKAIRTGATIVLALVLETIEPVFVGRLRITPVISGKRVRSK